MFPKIAFGTANDLSTLSIKPNKSLDNQISLLQQSLVTLNEAYIKENSNAPLTSEEFNIIDTLKRILQSWETKQYPDDKTRWEEYYMDIEELVQDIEEEAWLDAPSINEQILRKKTIFYGCFRDAK